MGFRKFGCINTWAVCLKVYSDLVLCVRGLQGDKTCSGQRGELQAGETEKQTGGKQQLSEETLVSHRWFVTPSLKNSGL